MNPMDSLFRELAEADSARQAPPSVEAALLAAFRPKPAPSRRVWFWSIASVAGSVIMAIAALWAFRATPKQQAAVPRVEPAAKVSVVVPPPAPVAPVVKPRHVARIRKAPRPVPAPEPRETVTDFIPVTPGEPIPSDEAPRVVRVRMPAAALASFGFRVDADRAFERVQADVMLRQDGSPSAIRLVDAAVFR